MFHHRLAPSGALSSTVSSSLPSVGKSSERPPDSAPLFQSSFGLIRRRCNTGRRPFRTPPRRSSEEPHKSETCFGLSFCNPLKVVFWVACHLEGHGKGLEPRRIQEQIRVVPQLLLSPVRSQSTDFPNALLIAKRTAAPGSFSPRSRADR